MSATTDLILERHRVRRRLAFWRILAIVAVVIAIIALLPGNLGLFGSHVARVEIEGIIVEDPEREQMIADLAADDTAKAVIVHINSRGGTIAASEALHLALRKVAREKPVVAVMSEYAASGGYITAIAADHIVARGNTITGSIGVVLEAPNVAELLETLGIGVTRVKSGPLKAEPSLTTEPSPEALRAQEDLINDTFEWFRGLVATRRGLDGAALDAVTDGRAYTGRQALERGLVDILGGEETALDWLETEHQISGLSVRDWTWGESAAPWPFGDGGGAALVIRELQNLATTSPRLYAIIQ